MPSDALDTSKIAYQLPQPGGMVPDIFVGGGLELDGEEREWVPQSADVWFGPLVLCVSQGYYINILRVRAAGICRGIAIPGRCTRSLCAGAGAIWSMIGSRGRATMPSSRRARRTRWWCRRAWRRSRRCFTSRVVTLMSIRTERRSATRTCLRSSRTRGATTSGSGWGAGYADRLVR